MGLDTIVKVLAETPVLAEDAAAAVAKVKSDTTTSGKISTAAQGLAVLLAELAKAL